MKLFLYKILLIFVLLLLSVPFWVKLRIVIPIGYEVDESINLVNNTTSNSLDTIIIGDSVGKNLNPKQQNKNGVLNICCNQAISALGHLLLLKTALKTQKINKTVVVGFFRPSSLLNSNLDQEWTNNYFIKKFYNNKYFFNENLLTKNLSKDIDLKFLSRYKPWSDLHRLTFFEGYSPLSLTFIGNNTKGHQKLSLIKYLLNSELQTYLTRIKFQAMPVHSEYIESEKKAALKLRKMGLKIEDPVLIDDTCFNSDKIHIDYRKINFVKNILFLKITNND